MAPRRAKKVVHSDSESEDADADLTLDPPTSIDPYSVLDIPKTASNDDIKKAYRKLALKNHPDKATLDSKDAAHVKFQEIAFAYAVLSDEKRRARYDKTGRTDEAVSLEDDDFNWADFFKASVEEVTGARLEEFKKEYQGSEEERGHVLEAYMEGEGDLDAVFESVMVSDPLQDEERFRGIIDAAIKKGEVQEFKAYTKESKKKRQARREKASKEAQEAEEMAKEMGVDDKLWAGKGTSKSKGGKGKKGKDDDQSGLAALIQQRQKSRGDMFDAMFDKYAPNGKGAKKKRPAIPDEEDGPSEEAFQAMDARLKKAKKARGA